ncbi:MAG: AsmA family protein [Rhodocyclaceae bacterium]|nr:AsmA family protein [Rhodocyclaceae bacterium]
MKILKAVGIVMGILVALVLAAVAVVYAMFDAESIKSQIAGAVQEKKQRSLKIDGPVALSLWPNVAISLGKISLSEHRSEKEFAALDSARVSVAVLPLLSKRVVVNTVELTGLKATVIKHKDGSLNIADLISPDKSDPSPVQVDVAAIKVANAQLTWRDEGSGHTTAISGLDLSTGRIQADTGRHSFDINALALSAKGKQDADSFEIKLDAPRLSITPEKSGGDSVTLSAQLTGAGKAATLKLSLAGVEGNAQALKIGKLSLDLDAKSGDATVKGKLSSPVQADITAQSIAVPQLAGELEIASPAMPMKQVKLPLTGSAKADLDQQSASLLLKTQFDESKIDAKAHVSKFAPLALAFDLDIDQLNLDKYLPPKKAGESSGGGAGGDAKVDLSPLKALGNMGITGKISIGQLQVSSIKASNLRFEIKAGGGRLDVAPMAMNLYEGSLNGALSLNASGNSVALRQNLANVAINPLMKDAVDKDLLEGRGNVALDITTHGDTVGAMKKALAGSASLALRDGAVKGINLAQSFRDLKAKFSSKQDAVQQAKAGDKTDFSELTGSFRIAAGVAHNEDLAAKSPFLRLAGAGDIDIGNGQMNYLAKASVVATAAGQGGQGLEHLKGLTVPVRVSGPFEKLSYKLELSGLASEAVKAKVEEKKEEVKARAQDKVKDKFKGLFGK